MMVNYVDRSGLKVAAVLADFIEQRALRGTNVDPEKFWRGFARLVAAASSGFSGQTCLG